MDPDYYVTHSYSLVICRDDQGKWLCVKEIGNQGWWIAGGHVDPGESLYKAAIRETQEEAGIDIELKGVLRIEHTPYKKYARLRVIFFAIPKNPNQKPKSIADKESEYAEFLTLDQIKGLKNQSPGWRGDEIYVWPSYIENGGSIIPLNYLSSESREIIINNNFISLNKNLTISNTNQEKFSEAIRESDIQTIKEFLVKGLNPNFKVNHKEWNPLHFAIKLKNIEIISALLLYGADIDAITHRNRNCLHFAFQENLDICNIFLMKISTLKSENRVKVLNRQDLDEGCTPLHLLATRIKEGEKELFPIYEGVILMGADKNIKNFDGKSTLDIIKS